MPIRSKGGGGVTDISCRVYETVAQTIPNLAWTAIDFGTGKGAEDYDTDTIHDMTTNPTRLTCKTAGKYLVFGSCEFYANTVGVRDIVIMKNGAPGTGTSICTDFRNACSAYSTATALTGVAVLAVNDYVELYGLQTSGGNLNTVAIAGSTSFGMIKVA